MERVDITIIGAGVVGLAVARALSKLGKNIIVIEKNSSFGQETSSRNSEVIHAGIYYPKESLKSKTCINGKDLLYDFCKANNIPHKKLGKLIVATEKNEVTKLNAVYNNALQCGLTNLRILKKREIIKLEPDVDAETAIFSPDTGIMNSHSLMKCLFKEAKNNNVDFAFSVEAKGIKHKNALYEVAVEEPEGDTYSFESRVVINCAGLWADKVAGFVGIDPETSLYKTHYSKGQYFRIKNPGKFSITHLVYPPPTETDLGIHVTPDLGGGLRLGPDAVYVSEINYDIDEKDRGKFFNSAKKFLPNLKIDDIIPDTAGIRAKLQPENGPFRDFVIQDEKELGFPGFIDVIGIESPGLTSSLAIGELVKSYVETSVKSRV